MGSRPPARPRPGAIAVLDAPSNLGLRPPAPGREPGVRRLPAALRAAGLLAALGAHDAGSVPPPPYHPAIEPETGIRNSRAIATYATALASRVQALLAGGHWPLVLGGDCSILLGNLLALRRRGHYGLVFLDGHTDFGTPATSQTGGAAGMDLALATGHGPAQLADLDGLGPLVREQDVVVLGHRDVDDPAQYAWRAVFDTGMALFSLEQARALGVEAAARRGLARLRRNGVQGFWVHLDVDVLDDTMMPAVDSRQPGGLSFEELIGLLRVLAGSGLAVGMHVTIFDPDLDPDGHLAAALAHSLAAGLAAAAPR